jgi:Ca2+-binding EF-hand superfamily protein
MIAKLTAGLLAGLAATAAVAQLPPAGFAPGARDGVQTRAEVVGRVQRMFARLDQNRDGTLTQQEAQAARQQLGARQGRRGQRAVDPALRQQRSAQAFARHDRNRDGVISRAEFEQVRTQRGQLAARGQGRGLRGMADGRLFAMADLDRDGRVTLREATAGALSRFDRADRNRDGVVTRDERLQARQQVGLQRRG